MCILYAPFVCEFSYGKLTAAVEDSLFMSVSQVLFGSAYILRFKNVNNSLKCIYLFEHIIDV